MKPFMLRGDAEARRKSLPKLLKILKKYPEIEDAHMARIRWIAKETSKGIDKLSYNIMNTQKRWR